MKQYVIIPSFSISSSSLMEELGKCGSYLPSPSITCLLLWLLDHANPENKSSWG